MPYTPYYPTYQYYQPPMPDQLAQLRQGQMQNMQQPLQQPPMQQPVQQPSIVWVPNEQAAREYLVAPNSAVTLWDSSAPVVYLKQADASGKPTLTTYDLVERTQRPVQAQQVPSVEYAPLSRLEALEARLDALVAVKEPSRPAKKTTAKEDAE